MGDPIEERCQSPESYRVFCTTKQRTEATLNTPHINDESKAQNPSTTLPELEQLVRRYPRQVFHNPALALFLLEAPARALEVQLIARELLAEQQLILLESCEERRALALCFAQRAHQLLQSRESLELLQEAAFGEASSIARRAAILFADNALLAEQSQRAFRLAFLEEREQQAQLMVATLQRSAA